MKCQTLGQLQGEVFTFIRNRVQGNKYVVIYRIERQHLGGMLEPNGQMMEFFDSPTKAVEHAKTIFAIRYPDRKMEVRRPANYVPGDIGERQHAASMIIKVLLDSEGGMDSVKCVVYLMTPEDIAKLMMRTEEVCYDLASFPGQLVA